MPRKKIQLTNGEIYHIVLRAVGDTEVFVDNSDYYRGIFSIYEFNSSNFVEIWRRRRDRMTEKKIDKTVGSPTPHNLNVADKRNKLVDVWAFAFMPNHVHLLVKQTKDNGITKFMQKVGGGYANYFNKKYKRRGHLFNQFLAIHINNDDQFRNVFAYIHANPVSLIEPGFKENGIVNRRKAFKFLENYKWSSYQDYIGKKNFQSVANRDFLLETFGGYVGCKNIMKNWLEYKGKPRDFSNIILE